MAFLLLSRKPIDLCVLKGKAYVVLFVNPLSNSWLPQKIPLICVSCSLVFVENYQVPNFVKNSIAVFPQSGGLAFPHRN